MESSESNVVVLLVDDNETLTNLLALLLSTRLQALVIRANCCEAARREVERMRPTVLMTDLNLPDGDGLGLAEEIQSSCPDIRLVLMSADVRSEVLQRARKKFAYVAALSKPFDSRDILDAVSGAATLPARAVTDGVGGEGTPMRNGQPDATCELDAIEAELRKFLSDANRYADDETRIRALVAGPLEHLLQRVFNVSARWRVRMGR